MIGTTLGAIREYVESLACPDGRYYLVCGRTGDRPAPAHGLAFESRATARAAAVATEQYRDALARYDPTAPTYDVIVCERLRPEDVATRSGRATRRTDVDEVHSSCGASYSRDRIDACHTVAGAVFEAIAASDWSGLEDAVMDTYLAFAEETSRPDDLCLRLLRSIAVELDARLEPAEQATLLATAAANLPSATAAESAADPLEHVLAALRSIDLLEAYALERLRVDRETGERVWTVVLEGYAFADGTERVVTFPIVVELFGRLATRSLSVTGAERLERSSPTWRLRVSTHETEAPRGLVRVSAGDLP